MAIPLPGAPGTGFLQGADTGSAMMQRLMQNRQAQEALKIQQLQEQRMQEMMPLEIQMKQLAALQAQQDYDIEKGLFGGGFQGTQEMDPSQMGGVSGNNSLLQSILSGGGVNGFDSSQGSLRLPQQGGQQPPSFENMSDMQRAWLKGKKKLEANETPMQKRQRDLEAQTEALRQKIQVEQGSDKTYITEPYRTSLQEQQQNISTTLEVLEKLANVDPQRFNLGTAKDKEYFLTAMLAADTTSKSAKIPNAQKIVQELREDLHAGKLEKDKEYRKRIIGLYNLIANEGKKVDKTLETGKVSPLEPKDFSQDSKKTVMGTMNGRSFNIPIDQVAAFEAEGGVINE